MNLVTISSQCLNESWTPRQKIIENCINNKENYYECLTGLPDEIVFYILTFLPLHNQVTVGNVSYQFYAISKPIRDKVDTQLTEVYKELYRNNSDLFKPINKATYNFSLWDFNYIYNEKGDIQFMLDKWGVGNGKENLKKVKQELGNANCLFVGRRIKSINFNYDHNYELTFDSSLKTEWQLVAKKIMETINSNGK